MTISDISRLRHDLRTPVNHLLGYSQLLLEDVADGDANESAWKPRIQQVVCLGQEILRTIETCLSASDNAAAERQLPELRSRLHKPVNEIQENLLSITLPADAPQVADIQRLLQASSRLSRFAAGGSLYDERNEDEASCAAPNMETRTGKALLLLVDDDLANREVVGRMLVRLDYNVHFAGSGPEALELISNHSYDLVLLDILMPGMSGCDLLRKIKDLIPNLPVIVASAVSELKVLIDCLEHGAEDYFLKPFEPVLLRMRISAVLKRTRQASTVPAARSPRTNDLEELSRVITIPLGFIVNSAELATDSLTQLRQTLGHEEKHIEDLLIDLGQSLAIIQRYSAKATQALKRIAEQQVP